MLSKRLIVCLDVKNRKVTKGIKFEGNVEIGEGAKVAAGSVVLEDVEANTTVAGVPAIAVGRPSTDSPAKTVDHSIKD